MKVLAINSSPKTDKGNLDIKPCQGEFNCWLKTPGECFQDDDMGDVVLSWEGGIPPFAGERSPSPQGPWSPLTPQGGINDRSWVDARALSDGADYFYRIESP